MIPRLIHMVWVGDDSKCPHGIVQGWREKNPRWNVLLWRNEDLKVKAWRHQRWIEHFWGWEMCGVADAMRWQILEEQGGFAIDADAPCLRPLDDWLFEADAFACWENERIRPGLINNGFVACKPNDPLVQGINQHLEAVEIPEKQRAWQTTGPALLTAAWQAWGRHWTIWPSHLFLPSHFGGERYTGNGPVYADQKWGSTVGYEGLSGDHLHADRPQRAEEASPAGCGGSEASRGEPAGPGEAQAWAAQGFQEPSEGEMRC